MPFFAAAGPKGVPGADGAGGDGESLLVESQATAGGKETTAAGMGLSRCAIARVSAVALLFAGVGVTVAVVGERGPRPLHGNVASDLALYGEGAQYCPACEGEQCGCSWANEHTCASQDANSPCCWACCCGAFQVPVSPQPSYPVKSDACELSDGQYIHMTGNSGTRYTGMVQSSSGPGVFSVIIGSESFVVFSEYIDECGRSNKWFAFWLPLVLCIITAFAIVWLCVKKYKQQPPPGYLGPSRGCHPM